MRLSLLARLFGRNKPEPSVATSAGSSRRLQPEPLLRASAVPPPRAWPPVQNEPDASRRPPLPVETQEVTAASAPIHDKPPVPVVPVKPKDEEVLKATKMAPQEELSIKINEGLKSLSTVLGAIDEKLGQQARSTELVADRLQTLPRVLEGLVEAERMNLETLRELRTSMEKQTQASVATSEKLDKLPTLVDGLGGRVDKQTEAAFAVRTSVETVSQSVRGLVDGAQRAQNSLITEFRRGQDDQRQRLETLVDKQRKTTFVIAAIGVVVVIALLIVLTRLPR